MSRRFLRIPEVKQRTGLSTPTIYRLIAAQRFPASVPLGLNSVGWVEDEVDAWSDQRIAERDERLSQSSAPERPTA